MKHLLKASTLAIALSIAPIMSAHAHVHHQHNQTPSKESLVELMEVVNMDQMFKDMGSQNDTMIQQMIEQELSRDNELTDSQKTRISATASKYITEMNKSYFEGDMRNTLINKFVTVAQKHYTQAEVDAQIDFYSSDVGQGIIRKQSAVMQDYMTTVMPAIMEHANQQSETLMPQMMDEIYEIIAEEE